MSENPIPEPIPCNECQAGMMRLRFITYFTWLGEELITAPNFPAWVCDVCGRREYDEKAISWLTMLLNPNAGRPTRKRSLARRTARRPAAPPSAESKPTR
jgi:YgiT-type zinc finger domain-containing protein